MKRHCLALLLLVAAAPLAAQRPASEIIDMARRGDAGLHQALVDTLEARAVKEGSAVIGYGEDFIFVVESPHEPKLMIGEKPGPAMVQLQDSSLWYATAKLKTGTSHQFEYIVNGKPFGGNRNVPAYGPDSYPSGACRRESCRSNWCTSARASTRGCAATIGSTCPRNITRARPPR